MSMGKNGGNDRGWILLTIDRRPWIPFYWSNFKFCHLQFNAFRSLFKCAAFDWYYHWTCTFGHKCWRIYAGNVV